MAKKKMDELTSFKLVYCGELLLFAIIFAVLSVLFILRIIGIKEWKYWVFPILTLCGGIWFIIDFIWLLFSKERQKKNSLIDKILPMPCSLAVIGFDIYFLISNCNGKIGDENYEKFFSLVIGIVLGYYALVYLFEGIYHYFKPSKALLYAYEDAMKKVAEEEAKEKAQEEAKQAEDSEKEENKNEAL